MATKQATKKAVAKRAYRATMRDLDSCPHEELETVADLLGEHGDNYRLFVSNDELLGYIQHVLEDCLEAVSVEALERAADLLESLAPPLPPSADLRWWEEGYKEEPDDKDEDG